MGGSSFSRASEIAWDEYYRAIEGRSLRPLFVDAIRFLPTPQADDPGMQVVDALLGTSPPDTPQVDGEAAGRAVAEAERHINGNGLPTDPAERARLRADLQASLDYLNDTEPTPAAVPAIPTPAATATRLGTVLGGLELVKASYRAMFPGAPDGIDQEWALTMAASDLIGQMLDYHRRPAFADPGLNADLRTIAEQLDQAAAARLT